MIVNPKPLPDQNYLINPNFKKPILIALEIIIGIGVSATVIYLYGLNSMRSLVGIGVGGTFLTAIAIGITIRTKKNNEFKTTVKVDVIRYKKYIPENALALFNEKLKDIDKKSLEIKPQEGYLELALENKKHIGLPATLFKNVKEGGVIRFYIDKQLIEYTCYHIKKFEKILKQHEQNPTTETNVFITDLTYAFDDDLSRRCIEMRLTYSNGKPMKVALNEACLHIYSLGLFTAILPFKLFRNMKEGGIVRYFDQNKLIELTCRQKLLHPEKAFETALKEFEKTIPEKTLMAHPYKKITQCQKMNQKRLSWYELSLINIREYKKIKQRAKTKNSVSLWLRRGECKLENIFLIQGENDKKESIHWIIDCERKQYFFFQTQLHFRLGFQSENPPDDYLTIYFTQNLA